MNCKAWVAKAAKQPMALETVDLVPLGVEGAIIGTALYVGNFTLTDALALTRDPAGSAL